MTDWHLLAIGPNRERGVIRELERLQYAFWIFWRHVQRAVRGRYIDTLQPAWPGYVFIRAHGAWDEIRDIKGTIDFVRFGGEPARVSDSVIAGLLARAPDGILPVEPKKARFGFGERVRIKGSGLLAGHAGIFQYVVDDHRVIVLQEWLGRFVPIELDENDIEPEPPAKNKCRKRRHRRRRPAP
jgi:transcriptional antiterminator RfaH